jgi:hypothetical protein
MTSFVKIFSMEKTSTDNSYYADSPEYKRGIEKRITNYGIDSMRQNQISSIDIDFFSEILILSMNKHGFVSTKQLITEFLYLFVYNINHKKDNEVHFWKDLMPTNFFFFYKGVYYLGIIRYMNDHIEYTEYFHELHRYIDDVIDKGVIVCLMVNNFNISHNERLHSSHIYYHKRIYATHEFSHEYNDKTNEYFNISTHKSSHKSRHSMIFETHNEHLLNATIVISDTPIDKLLQLYNDIYENYYVEIILLVHDDFITTRHDILDEAKEMKAHSHILTKNHTLFIKDVPKKSSILSTLFTFFKGERKGERKGKSKIKSKSKSKSKRKGKETFYDSTGGNTKKMHYNKRARLRQKRSYKISHAKLHTKTQRKIHKSK